MPRVDRLATSFQPSIGIRLVAVLELAKQKPMKKAKENLEDDLRPEYDFHSLRVIARGLGRQKTEKEMARQS